MTNGLPKFNGVRKVIKKNQDTGDIMQEVVNAHNAFARDYNNLVEYYDIYPLETMAKKLFNFCKTNIAYKVESENLQTTRSPAGILRLAHGDCKHYAGFIAGVIDAVARATKTPINWAYRFASYDIFDDTPVHVFVVVNDDGREIWIDPVLDTFDQRTPFPTYYIDKKPKNMLMRLSGTGTMQQQRPTHQAKIIGSTGFENLYQQQAAKVSAAESVITSQIPFYDLAKGLLTSFFGKGGISDWLSPTGILNELKFALFGRAYRSGQYWLGEKFKYYVLGEDIHTRDADIVTDQAVSTAITVFSVGFGVPVEDYQDILNLDQGSTAYINRYKLLGVPESSINLAAVNRAVQLKQTYFKFNEVPRGVVPVKWNPNDFNRIPFVAPIPDFTKPYSQMWQYTYTGAIPGGEVKNGVVIAGPLSKTGIDPKTGLPYTDGLLPTTTAPGAMNAKNILIIGAVLVGGYFLLKRRR